MRNILFATTALAFAGAVSAGPAAAADMLSLGVGGYMEQWIGYANRDDSGVDGGFDVQTDAEVHFKGSLESDSGLKFTVHVELEAANDSVSGLGADGDKKTDETEIDEAFVRVSGAFGDIEIGQRDPIHARMHYAAAGGAGAGLNAGDTGNWVPGKYLETAGWTIPGDNRNIIYITPRVNGVQVGLSYGPDSKNENSAGGAPKNNDDAVWAAAINFNETVGDMSVKVSLGHVNVSNPGMTAAYRGDNATSGDTMMMGYDDKSYTNAGVSVGMGAFTFGASYATRDDGGYVLQCLDTDDDVVGCGTVAENGTFPGDGTTSVGNDDGSVSAVEDESGQHDTWAVGVGYSDGPLSLSIGHVSREQEDGDERAATMISAGYKLAPGVAWKTSIFGVEDDTEGLGRHRLRDRPPHRLLIRPPTGTQRAGRLRAARFFVRRGYREFPSPLRGEAG